MITSERMFRINVISYNRYGKYILIINKFCDFFCLPLFKKWANLRACVTMKKIRRMSAVE